MCGGYLSLTCYVVIEKNDSKASARILALDFLIIPTKVWCTRKAHFLVRFWLNEQTQENEKLVQIIFQSNMLHSLMLGHTIFIGGDI